MSKIQFLIALILLGFFLIKGSLFTVQETEKAIKFKFGEIINTDYKPGIHAKIPFVNNVKKFDARILSHDSRPERFLTKEKKNVLVDSFVKWRINAVGKFYTAVQGNPATADIRIGQIMKDAMRAEFGKHTVKEVISQDRQELRDVLVNKTQPAITELGIELIDIRVKRIDLEEQVSASVFRRMETERARDAKDLRSRGAAEATRIRADADKQAEIILAEAYRDAEKMRGEGDAKATSIYAEAYNADPEFYSFYKSLDAYKKVFKGNGDMIVLEPDSDFFTYFGKKK
ncbi:MAG: protease modulator HflC [Gammaproteobacteria bacterium]|nr:protease modulator HflC [Gammaproteobacteria bacterium]